MRRICFSIVLCMTAISLSAQYFSVSPEVQVQFSRGNLQYCATTNTFRFAEQQYTLLGELNNAVGETNKGWIDLFGWATSGFDNTTQDPLAIHYQPWSWICELGAELDYELNQFGYGPSQNRPDRDMQASAANYDWGTYCTIGKDAPGTWRTLSREEWRYMLFLRPNADRLRQRTQVCGQNGLLIMPDGYDGVIPDRPITKSVWKKLEKSGVVFLPMAGARYHFRTADVGQMGSYWTSTCHNQASAYFVGVYQDYVCLSSELYGRHTGRSVRLVRNVSSHSNTNVPADLQPNLSTDPEELRYVDASSFRIINQAFPDLSFSLYTRLPLWIQDSVSREFWHRSTNSAGIAIRFATNSARIAARYNLRDNFRMKHMADTGIKGTDLYILDDAGVWRYVNTARPLADSVQHKVYTENNDGRMHEYMIYLPLYDGINWFQIGVDEGATIVSPMLNTPDLGKKIVCYGTSIMQGGCASRTGMVATSIIQRELDLECVNLAISGEGRMTSIMSKALASIPDVSAYVIDCVPNSTEGMCDTLTEPFVHRLLQAHPDVPVILVESPDFTFFHDDLVNTKVVTKKNAIYRNAYLRLEKQYPGMVFYLYNEGLSGMDEEGTVDGIHLTDLGFRAYADKLEAVLREVLHL